MSNALTPRQTTRALRDSTGIRPTRQKPRNGQCEGCDRRIGMANLRLHHCHECGAFISWLCDDCNLALTEHLIEHLPQLTAMQGTHNCHSPLFHHPRSTPIRRETTRYTRPLHLSNGGGDNVRTVSISTLAGHITVEQLAVILGVNAQTARDIASGRNKTRPGIGHKLDGTWFIHQSDVIVHLTRTWAEPKDPPA